MIKLYIAVNLMCFCACLFQVTSVRQCVNASVCARVFVRVETSVFMFVCRCYKIKQIDSQSVQFVRLIDNGPVGICYGILNRCCEARLQYSNSILCEIDGNMREHAEIQLHKFLHSIDTEQLMQHIVYVAFSNNTFKQFKFHGVRRISKILNGSGCEYPPC